MKNYPVRKVQLRRYYPEGAVYFITNVAEDRNPLCLRPDACLLLLDVVREERARLGFLLSAYVILPDHFHVLVQPGVGANISEIMRAVKSRSTLRYNRMRNSRGKVWQHQFLDHILRTHEDYRRHLDYLHGNPLKHQLVADLADYRWSSWHQYEGREPVDLRVDFLEIRPGRLI